MTRRLNEKVGSAWLAVLMATMLSVEAGVGCTLNPPVAEMLPADAGADEGGGAVPASSGVARNVRLFDLTSTQAAALCDWTNAKQGGYGRLQTCPSGLVQSTSSSTLGCVNSTSALGGRCLSLTVGGVEDCANATGTDLCKLETAPECLAVATCT